MKFKNLMDIPTGYKMRMTKSFCGYPTGTVITRGHDSAPCDDDEKSVAFTLPDGNYIYFEAHEVEPVPYEKPVLLPEDKIQIEMTALEMWCIYAMLGNQCGNCCYGLFDRLGDTFDDLNLHSDVCNEDWEFYKDCDNVKELVMSVVFPKHQNEKTKEISEIKEQLKELEKRLEELENEE